MKILCIGRNYADHAAELKNEVPKEPVVFGKPDSAILQKGRDFYLPDFSQDVHHELEVVLKMSKMGKHVAPKFAHKYFTQVTVGIDFTARDLQSELKSKGLPWEKAKGFDGSAVVGEFFELEELGGDIQNLNIRLEVNGVTRQEGNTSQMIFPVDVLISHLSTYYTWRHGDLLFTGTPAGVGKVETGDILTGYINDKKAFEVGVK